MNENKKADPASLLLGRSRIRRAILALLVDGPRDRLHLREIQRRVGTSPGTAARELERLVVAGLLERETEGRQVYFRARRDTPLFEPVRDLVRRTIGVPNVLRRHLAGLGGVERAVVFGSYARGTETAASDIDLLVVGRPDADELTDRIGAAEREIGRPVNYVVITEGELAERRARGDRFVASVDAGPTLSVVP